jgi:peptidoglycan hydrolase-like protein with peptidoglycan-binding domain
MSVRIITRREWGAAFTIPGGRHVAPSARRWFVVHWPGSAVASNEQQVVRNIESFHRRNLGWAAAPGYNFLVGRSGTIYEGCGRDVRGIHSPPRNTDGWGVCVMIAVGETPPQAALNATRALYEWLSGVAGRRLGMAGHSTHHPTACPGPNLIAWVNRGMPSTGGAPAPPPPPGTPAGAPGFPGRILRQPPIMRGEDTRTWQGRVRARGWGNVVVDGAYGPISEGACRQVQQIARLNVDGRVGPQTWPATWRDSAGPPGGTAPAPPAAGGAPPFPGPILRQPPIMRNETARRWQARMRERGWNITVDGAYGPRSEATCREFQRRFGLATDGRVGPLTWGRTFGS